MTQVNRLLVSLPLLALLLVCLVTWNRRGGASVAASADESRAIPIDNAPNQEPDTTSLAGTPAADRTPQSAYEVCFVTNRAHEPAEDCAIRLLSRAENILVEARTEGGCLPLPEAGTYYLERLDDRGGRTAYFVEVSGHHELLVAPECELRLRLEGEAATLPSEALLLVPLESPGTSFPAPEAGEAFWDLAEYEDAQLERLVEIILTDRIPGPQKFRFGSPREDAWEGLRMQFSNWSNEDGAAALPGRSIAMTRMSREGDRITWHAVPTSPRFRLALRTGRRGVFSNAGKEEEEGRSQGLSWSGVLRMKSGEPTEISLRLPPITGVMGWLVPQKPEQVREARILLRTEYEHGSRDYMRTTTDGPGFDFLFEGVAAGPYSIECSWWESDRDLFVASTRFEVGSSQVFDCGPLAPSGRDLEVVIDYRIDGESRQLEDLLGDIDIQQNFQLLDLRYRPTHEEVTTRTGPRYAGLIPLPHRTKFRLHGLYGKSWGVAMMPARLRLKPDLGIPMLPRQAVDLDTSTCLRIELNLEGQIVGD